MKLLITMLFLLSLSAQAELYRYDFATMPAGHVQTMTASNDVRGYVVYLFVSRRESTWSPVVKQAVVNIPQPSGVPWFTVEFPDMPGLYMMIAGSCDSLDDYRTCTDFENTMSTTPRGLLFWVE